MGWVARSPDRDLLQNVWNTLSRDQWPSRTNPPCLSAGVVSTNLKTPRLSPGPYAVSLCDISGRERKPYETQTQLNNHNKYFGHPFAKSFNGNHEYIK
ncbi:hypothetical protein TNCV_537271 [Trichonephila clavipes]|nr:hypothetical protein TNCV_537271 [Trichonephila clavipes]